MKFSCECEDLLGGIQKAARALGKTSNPVLEGMLFIVGPQGLSLTCTDHNITITSHVPAMVQEEGSAVIPGRFCGEIVRKLPPGEVMVTMEEGNSSVLIQSGKAKFTVPVLAPAVDFPMMPEVNPVNPLVLTQGQLRHVLRSTLFACAVDDSKPIFTGALFEVMEDVLNIVALDGYRLALCHTTPKQERIPIDFVVPARYLSEITRLLSEDDREVTLYVGTNQMVVDMENTRIITRLLEGEFIKYRAILPKEYSTRVSINAKALLESAERASLMASMGKNNLVKIELLEDTLIVTSKSESGEMQEELPVVMNGKGLKIAFNANYLMESLRAVGDREVYLDFTTNINPCVITSTQPEDDFYHLVLPVRIYNE